MTVRVHVVLCVVVALLCSCSSAPAPRSIDVLVFTHTLGFRHDSIPAGVETMRALCKDAGYRMKHTEEPGAFRPESLALIDVVVFLNTTGDVLNEDQQEVFESWWTDPNSRRGFLGIHSAADTEYDWPFYQSMIGAHFTGHPPVQKAIVVRASESHPATRMLPEHWERVDEWYNYDCNPRDAGHTVLLAMDTDSYEGSTMPGDHPIAWCREFESFRGRMLYTGGGHTIESFGEPLFREHLLAALRWVAHDETD